jgi:hypothetical protein
LTREQAALADALTEIAPLAAWWQTRAEMDEATILCSMPRRRPTKVFSVADDDGAAAAASFGYLLLLSCWRRSARSRPTG